MLGVFAVLAFVNVGTGFAQDEQAAGELN